MEQHILAQTLSGISFLRFGIETPRAAGFAFVLRFMRQLGSLRVVAAAADFDELEITKFGILRSKMFSLRYSHAGQKRLHCYEILV